jgi:hypothetical protein
MRGVMVNSYYIRDIHERVIEYGPYEWIDPKDIKDLDLDLIKAKNKKDWFGVANVEDISDEESDDEIIVDYLVDCLSEQKSDPTSSIKIPQINELMFLEAAIFLICELGSSYAKTHMAKFKTLISEQKSQECINLVIANYKNISELFIKDIYRDFVLEVFEYGPLWEWSNSKYKILDQHSNKFLEQIFKNGYFTIDNDDARYFSDGTKRF